MRKFFLVFVLYAIIATSAHASFRARYSGYTLLEGNKTEGAFQGQPHNESSMYFDYVLRNVIPGIWDGFDSETGFDNVSDPYGDISEATHAHAGYWVDSLNQGQQDGHALIDGWMTSDSWFDSSYSRSFSGEAVMLAGGYKVESAGEQEFEIICKDGSAIWFDLNRDGEIDFTSEDELVWGERRYDTPGFNYTAGATDINSPESFTVNFSEPGLYKMLVYHYHHSEVTAMKLFRNGSIIPAEKFGEKKGPPKVKIVEFTVDGTPPESDLPFIEVCANFEMKAEADGNIAGSELLYFWDFQSDEVIDDTTTENSVSFQLGEDEVGGVVTPSVAVHRVSDNVTSSLTLSRFSFFGSPCSTPVLGHDLGIQTFISGSLLTIGNPGNYTLVVHNISGKTIKELPITQTVFDLSEMELSKGFYQMQLLENGKLISDFTYKAE